MISLLRPFDIAATLAVACLVTPLAGAQAPTDGKVLNLYSARHYQTDEALYENFSKTTGIRINRIDVDDAGLLARLKSEGASSPADVLLLVDAARLWRGEIEGLFQPVRSKTLESKIPTTMRGKDGGAGSSWFGLSTRARVFVIDKATVQTGDADTYEKLGSPKNKGKVCIRSGSHPYNLSLFGALLEHWGPVKTETWLKAVVGNLARTPKGGDTDQIRAVGSGECGIAVSNTYYLARLMRSDKAEDKALIQRVSVVFPDQAGSGTHVNIAGAAVAKHAPHRTAAVQFVEYLASDLAQRYFAEGNNEWPVVAGVKINNPALQSLGSFKQKTVPVALIGMNQIKVQQMLDRVGFR